MSITLRQQEVLRVLSQREQWSVKEVASTLGITSAAATKMIMRLERQGWVKRVVDEWDRRKLILSLSSAGKHELTLLKDRAEVN